MGNTTTVGYEAMISARARAIDVSGIRRVFELGAKLKNPINFSIGQPDFAVPDAIKEATIEAIRQDRNGYTLTQGDPELREALTRNLAEDIGWKVPSDERGLLVTSGTSGAIMLAFLATLDPGDEVIIPDPFFVIYPALGGIAGADVVFCDTYPDFRMTAERVEPLITPRTKLLMVNSPSNPSGVVLTSQELRDLVDLCEARGVMIIADEIYDQFTFSDALEDNRCPSPARFTERMLLVRGFGKTYGCTGWRMGYAAGPRAIIEQMAKLQQYSFVCAPSIAQRGLIGALGLDMSAQVAAYEAKRDMVEQALSPVAEIVHPGGAFYAFVRIPSQIAATATEFVERAIERNVLLIPGCVFSGRDTHMRLSYAVPDETLEAGLRTLTEMLSR
ncbi:MAG: pyridoxal phosphate-dependent aminotransferase [Planctomycetota bacterium]